MRRHFLFVTLGLLALLMATLFHVGHLDRASLAQSLADRRFPADAVVNVKTVCGLAGNGTQDDTQALTQCLQRFIDENGYGKGVTLYFPNGTYRISDSIIWKNFIILQGQSRTGTVLQLANSSPGFQDANQPKIVLGVGADQPPNYGVGFSTGVYDLTIDIGTGNPGAIGIAFYGNNESTLRRVNVRSSSQAGAIGLKLMEGACPGYLRDVEIEGFDRGIQVGSGTFCVLEHITLTHQREAGLFSELTANACSTMISIRGLKSTNAVPVIHNRCRGANYVLLDATLIGEANPETAILTNGPLFARNITAQGFNTILQDEYHQQQRSGTFLREYASETYSLFPGNPTSLNLPIDEGPHIEYEPPEQWVSVAQFGANPDDSEDDTAAIQQAIDSGARTIYFPQGDLNRDQHQYLVNNTITIRGNVQFILGMHQVINAIDRFKNSPDALFRIENTNHDYVLIEGIRYAYWSGVRGSVNLLHRSPRALIVRDVASTPLWEYFYRSEPNSGSVYFENVSGTRVEISPDQKLYAHQLNLETNPENSTETTFDDDHPPLLNDGGTLWLLGSKLESAYLISKTVQGGQSELLGINPLNVKQSLKEATAFEAIDSTQTIVALMSSFGNEEACCYINYGTAIRETRNSDTRHLNVADLRPSVDFGAGVSGPNRAIALYTSRKP
jgi:hypothetical protein